MSSDSVGMSLRGGASRRGNSRSRSRHARRHSTKQRVFAALVGMALVGGGAYAATNWIVGLAASSSGESQAATVQNLTITAVASPRP